MALATGAEVRSHVALPARSAGYLAECASSWSEVSDSPGLFVSNGKASSLSEAPSLSCLASRHVSWLDSASLLAWIRIVDARCWWDGPPQHLARGTSF